MSTSYPIFKSKALLIELDERSNTFSLDVTSGVDTALEELTAYGDFTPDEVIAMALEMLKVASYWTSEDEVRAAAAKYVQESGDGGYFRRLLSLLPTA
ncbi:hypothetical protein [Agrobacterium tumefaciens]|uniref:hypothetical protein n=1 Tax=Agrobacterium tumefaciens TaxID=358 RepID=UPI0021CE382B|nr:hypothetical protein [Agrobacterium tumefaciens]UXS23131.1 hypothetical protein FY153_01195 [Agrobacterium tumefaciens]